MTDIIKPVIKSISPTSGGPGTQITLSGSGFVDGNNIHGVFFNDVPTHDWVVLDDTKLAVLAPVGHEGGEPLKGSATVTVKTEGGIANFGGEPQTSNGVSFSYTA